MTPILLDTDPGSDIDDAVAIAYLCKQPLCELVGITTVTGNTAHRAAIAQIVCDAAGKPDVPIHAGLTGPLLTGPGQAQVPHYAAIASRPHRQFARNTAVDFMRQTIRSRPGEITLLSVGPLTNVAALFAVDPEIPSLLKGFVSMAGYFDPAATWSEWNLRVDPIATAIVYRHAPKGHLSVGLDVTMKCQMDREQVRAKFTKPPLDVVARMAEVWFKDSAAKMTFHDPLAAACIFNPEVCTYETGTVTIEQHEKHDQGGMSRFAPDASGPHRIARTVNGDAFFEEYFSRF